MKFTLKEPLVIGDVVLCHIALHFAYILRKCKIYKSFFALFGRYIYKAVAVNVGIFLCKFCYVNALITVLGEYDFVTLKNLEITGLE